MSRGVGMMWSPGSLPGEPKSHPDRLLEDHLKGTSKLAGNLEEIHDLGVDRELLRIVCETHDLEKANPAWQDYLLRKNGKVIPHAFPSSCFTLDATRSLWAAEAVRRHHTCMENVRSSCQFWLQREYDFSCLQAHMKEVVSPWTCFFSEAEWEEFMDNLWDVPCEVTCEDWLTMRSLYSLLIAADRMDAIGIRELEFAPLPDFTPLDFTGRDETPLDGWRKKVHEACVKNCGAIEKPGLYTLTLPTGAGKTTVGLEVAHLLAERWGYGTIIYALPFISIIEQNAAVAKCLFGSENVQEDHSRAYGELVEENGEKAGSWARMSALFRYWRTPVALTTMVQLWDCIFDPRANASMDFHRLSRAVVVLDEPQGIAPGLWAGFGRMLSFLSEKWGTAFILMTATQPRIGHGQEIAPSDLVFPCNRHTYHILPGKHGHDELPDLLRENLPIDQGSGLIVLNTKKSALKVYRMMKDRLDGPVLFLSAWMAPCHRRRVMRYLRYLEKRDIQRYLISTQVVEAGVDLDFDWVFRDMGPLDSVIQVAGRCNRHAAGKNPGQVLVVELVDDRGKSFCRMVYDDVLLINSRDVLVPEEAFDEKRVPELVEDYYTNVLEGVTHEPVWSNIENGLWGPDKKVDLIKKKDERQKETVFVELDRGVRPILNRLRDTKWTLESLDEKKRLLRQVQQYSIEISLKDLEAWRDRLATRTTNDDIPLVGRYEDEEYWFISREAVGIVYDRITGFVPADRCNEEDLNESFL